MISLEKATNKMRTGATTKDETITIGTLSYRTAENLIEAARALVLRGAPYVGNEAALLGAAWPHVQRRPVVDGLDVLLVQAASKFARSHPPAPEPKAPTPFDGKIAEAEAEIEPCTAAYDAARLARDAARDACDEAVRRYESAARHATYGDGRWPGEGPVGRAREVLREAERALADADAGWLRVRARLVALELGRDRYRAEQTSYVMGPNGQPVRMVDFRP